MIFSPCARLLKNKKSAALEPRLAVDWSFAFPSFYLLELTDLLCNKCDSGGVPKK
jgi:hypothetical protein